ncbi:MAG: hypothetical protein RQ824_10155 [bacterium]|nr:hypothetical protein [bacterium]
MKILSLLILALLLVPPTSSLAVEMTIHRPNEAFISEEGKLFTYDRAAMPLEEAKEVADYIFKVFGSGKYPFIYKVPGYADYYIVSAIGYQTDKDRGPRFFLIRKRNNRYRNIFTSKGAGDSYTPNPTFFYNENTVIILAEVGTDSCRGFSVFKFEEERGYLKWLGALDVAKPAGTRNEATSPIKAIRMFADDEKYRIEIFGDILYRPGDKGEKIYKYAGESFKFINENRSFIFQSPENGKSSK